MHAPIRQALLQLDLIIIGAGMSAILSPLSRGLTFGFCRYCRSCYCFCSRPQWSSCSCVRQTRWQSSGIFLFVQLSNPSPDIVYKSGLLVCASPQIYLKFFTLGVFTTNFRMLPDVAKLDSTQVSTHELLQLGSAWYQTRN